MNFHDIALLTRAEALPGMVESPLGTPAEFIRFWDGFKLNSVRLTFEALGIWESFSLAAAVAAVALQLVCESTARREYSAGLIRAAWRAKLSAATAELLTRSEERVQPALPYRPPH